MTVYGVNPEHTFIWAGGHCRQAPTPAGALSDLAFWLNPATLWLENPSTVVFSQAPQAMDRAALPAAIHAAGWSTKPTEGGWFTARRREGKTSRVVHLCILPWVPSTDPLLAGAAMDVHEAARRLDWWERMMGAPYRHTPGMSGHDALRAVPRRRSISWAPYKDNGALPSWEPPFNIRPLSFVDKTPDLDRRWPLHKWDTRRAYLMAMSTGVYPEGALQPTGTAPQGPGYLRVRLVVPEGRTDLYRLLLLLQLKPDRQGTFGIGTATAQVLADAGVYVEVIHSETAPGGRILRSWAEKVGKLHPDLGKPVYAESFGSFGTKAGSIQRRDWYHLIIDQANATLLRRTFWVGYQKAGMWPERIETDALLYRCTPLEVSPLGEILGAGMRYEGEWSK